MIRAFRLCKTKYAATAFSGEGARLAGGRWNSPGMPAVYTSSTLSLATLEVLVHLEDTEVFYNSFSWIPVGIPDDAVEVLDMSKLSVRWLSDEAGAASRASGDAWLRSNRTPALAVPSVVTPGEINYLLNPRQSRFAEIEIGQARAFEPDARIFGAAA